MTIDKLKKRLANLGLKRKNIQENIDDIARAIMIELEGDGSGLGYKMMWLKLRITYHLQVYRQTVLDLMRILDPSGIEERSRYRLKIRLYSVPGPNYIWHLDGYDKLVLYGFCIHGCMDGFSRKIIWLNVATMNKKPEVICSYYLLSIKKFKVVPTLMRSDHGTENSILSTLHCVLRDDHGDKLAGSKSFLKGKSTANQRIESFWGRMRRHSINTWINYFKDLRAEGYFDRHDDLHINCLRYCYGPLIQWDLDNTRREWNRHNIRKQKEENVLSGKPNYLYYNPEQFNAQPRGFPTTKEDEAKIETAFELYAEPGEYCDKLYMDLFDLYSGNRVCQPNNRTEAKALYLELINEIPKLLE